MSGTKMMEMIERVAKGDDAAVVVRESVEGRTDFSKSPGPYGLMALWGKIGIQ